MAELSFLAATVSGTSAHDRSH